MEYECGCYIFANKPHLRTHIKDQHKKTLCIQLFYLWEMLCRLNMHVIDAANNFDLRNHVTDEHKKLCSCLTCKNALQIEYACNLCGYIQIFR